MSKKKAGRTLLLNGCSRSEIKVLPNNWEDPEASVNIRWKIYYRFYDPLFKSQYPTGKLVPIQGMNDYKTLTERRKVTKSIIDTEKDLIDRRGYNPITKQFMAANVDAVVDYVIPPDTGMIEALTKAFKLCEGVDPKSTKSDLKSVLKYFSEAAVQLRIDTKPIKEIRKRHVLMVLDQVGRNKKDKWTSNNFNYYRSHLQMLFKPLTEYEAIEINPISDIAKRKRTEPPQEVVLLKEEQRIRINSDLRKDNYTFWRLLHIFYNSGARNTELVNVRYEDVDLKNQSCKYLVKKGRGGYKIVERPIKSIVLHLWIEIMREAKPGQYLFSKGLIPGPVKISPNQFTRRWKRWVKTKRDAQGNLKYGEVGNWYWLKHQNSDELSEILGTALTAKLNQHSETVLKKHYLPNQKKRESEAIKSADNSFAPL